MKTYQLKIIEMASEGAILKVLSEFAARGVIQWSELDASQTLKDPTEAQSQEIVEESELGPFYSNEETRNILHI